MFQFDHSLARDLEGFYKPSQAAQPPAPRMVLWNAPLAAMLNIPDVGEDQLARWFSGAEDLPGSQPLAMTYAGHQFGHFNPQLGDGRALLLGEVVIADGVRFDLQFKGSGPTPYSRGAIEFQKFLLLKRNRLRAFTLLSSQVFNHFILFPESLFATVILVFQLF